LLKEADVEDVFDQLCRKCKEHMLGFSHLTCGREGQHIMNDIEVNELIHEINRTDLLKLLEVEKGSSAKQIVETID